MRLINIYRNELNYIEEHYKSDWEQGYLTSDIYEWLYSIAQRLKDKNRSVLDFIKESLEELEDYEEGEEWTNKYITRYELYSFGASLNFLRECLETEEE